MKTILLLSALLAPLAANAAWSWDKLDAKAIVRCYDAPGTNNNDGWCTDNVGGTYSMGVTSSSQVFTGANANNDATNWCTTAMTNAHNAALARINQCTARGGYATSSLIGSGNTPITDPDYCYTCDISNNNGTFTATLTSATVICHCP